MAARYRRKNAGFTLVELLVALFVGSILILAVSSVLSSSFRQSTNTQNHFYANSLASTLIDYAQSVGYQTFFDAGASGGPQQLLVNRDAGGTSTSTYRKDPLLLDFQELVYSSSVSKNRFNGQVWVEWQNGPVSDSILVIVRVTWSDSTYPKGYSLVRTSILHKLGRRFWN